MNISLAAEGFQMARNSVQFQKGLSEAVFRAKYGTEEQCRLAVAEMRWPKGFICPKCGGGHYALIKTRHLFQCRRCRHQASLTAGTIFHSSKLPLTQWFLAMYHLTQSKAGTASLELARRLGVTANTAWKLKHKLLQVMFEREAEKPLTGRVEIDDAYLGGERSGGKRGRGAPGKTPFIAAVQTTDQGKPVRIKLRRVKGFRRAEVEKFARSALAPGSAVVSDGLDCFTSVTKAGCSHQPIVTGSGRAAAQHSAFKWVNTVLGNVKSAITGTYRSIRPKHIPRYLAEFTYRFNRRYDLTTIIERLAWVSLRTPPMPYRLLKLAEDCA
jgi:transposase-like protein